MRDILYAVMTVSLCAGIVCFLSPEGKNGGLKRQIGFAVSVAVCLALVSPLKKAVTGCGFDFTFPDIIAADTGTGLSGRADEVIRGELEYAVTENFGIKNAHVTLEFDRSDSQSLRLISACLSGEGDLSAAAAYLSEVLGCTVTVKEGQ